MLEAFDRKELEVIERLVRNELKKQERRPGNPPPGGRDVQAFKVERLKVLLNKIRKLVFDDAA